MKLLRYLLWPLAVLCIFTIAQATTTSKSVAVLFSATNGVCPQGGAYADGCAGAPAGSAQYPGLLTSYGANRPPWNVAGVDYYVGIPAGTVLTDWQSISNPNVTVNGSAVECTGAGATVTFDKIDFSLHGGAYIYNGSGGCANITVTNSNFACPTTAPAFAMIIDQNGATFTIKYNKFNGLNCGTPQLGDMISVGPPMVLEYNWFINSPQQVLDTGGTGTVEYHYNLLDNMVIGSGQHQNWMQLGGSGWSATLHVTFNTGYQTSLNGAEGFQFYSNTIPATLVSPVLQYNTMIALPSGGNSTMSYIVHGNCHSGSDCSSTTTTLSGTATNANNYFDVSGAFGAYYPGTMTTGMGWTNSGNIDMSTGGGITPP